MRVVPHKPAARAVGPHPVRSSRHRLRRAGTLVRWNPRIGSGAEEASPIVAISPPRAGRRLESAACLRSGRQWVVGGRTCAGPSPGGGRTRSSGMRIGRRAPRARRAACERGASSLGPSNERAGPSTADPAAPLQADSARGAHGARRIRADTLSHVAACLPEVEALVVWESALNLRLLDSLALRRIDWPGQRQRHLADIADARSDRFSKPSSSTSSGRSAFAAVSRSDSPRSTG